MDDSTPTSSAIPTTVAVPPVLDADDLIRVFTHFLTFDVADGAASAEKITYLEQDEANRLLHIAAGDEIFGRHVVKYGGFEAAAGTEDLGA
jgi:hypothetical protein